LKLLVIDDDRALGALLLHLLRQRRYAVDLAATAGEGFELALEQHYNAILLDVMLPDADGIDLCRRLREEQCRSPILLLTARSADVVAGLDAGADDYVRKPFEPGVLLARIRALLRRSPLAIAGNNQLDWGPLRLDRLSVRVTIQGVPVQLAPQQYRLLELFLSHPQRIFSRSAILDLLWPTGRSPGCGTVTNGIKDLRQALRRAGLQGDPIETVRGMGYRLRVHLEADEMAATLGDGAIAVRGERSQVIPGELGEPARPDGLRPWQPRSIQAVLQGAIADLGVDYGPEVAALHRFAQAIASGRPVTATTDALLAAALTAAHQLRGGLGTLGNHQGSILAGNLETLLGAAQGRAIAVPVLPLRRLLTALEQTLAVNGPPKAMESAPPPLAPAPPSERPLVLFTEDSALGNALAAAAQTLGWRLMRRSLHTPVPAQMAPHPPLAALVDFGPGRCDRAGLWRLTEARSRGFPLPTVALVDAAALTFPQRVALAKRGVDRVLDRQGDPHGPIQAALAIAQRHRPAPPPTVTLVDGNPHRAQAIATALHPYLHRPARHHPSAIATWTHHRDRPNTISDILLIHWQLPDLDGLLLGQLLHRTPQRPPLLILVIDPDTGPTIEATAFQTGFDDVLTYPLSPQTLRARTLLRLPHKRRTPPSPSPTIPPSHDKTHPAG
jgi:DNA-binding response OmpR family regulator